MIEERCQIIPQIVAKQITSKIRSGLLSPGDFLPSDNVLATEFGCGRSSVITALKQLEHSGLVIRQKGKGTIVAVDVMERLSCEKIAICRAMPPELSADFIGMTMELYTGAIEGGKQCGAMVRFEHLNPTDNPLEIQRQWEHLNDCHGVIFLGETSDYLLRIAQQNRTPAVRIPSSGSFFPWRDVSLVGIDVDSMINRTAEYLRDIHCRRVAIFSKRFVDDDPVIVHSKQFSNYKSATLRLYLNDYNVETEEFVCSDLAQEELEKRISDLITPEFCSKFDVLVALMTSAIPLVYKRLYELKLVPGRDLKILGLCSRISVMNLFPPPILYPINYEQIGLNAIKMLHRIIRGQSLAQEAEFSAWQIIEP